MRTPSFVAPRASVASASAGESIKNEADGVVQRRDSKSLRTWELCACVGG
jgi:hypothetical protein